MADIHPNSFPICFTYFSSPIFLTRYLAVAGQLCLESIPIKKYSWESSWIFAKYPLATSIVFRAQSSGGTFNREIRAYWENSVIRDFSEIKHTLPCLNHLWMNKANDLENDRSSLQLSDAEATAYNWLSVIPMGSISTSQLFWDNCNSSGGILRRRDFQVEWIKKCTL